MDRQPTKTIVRERAQTRDRARRRPGPDAKPRRDEPIVLHVLEALAGGTSRHLVDLVQHAKGVRHVVAVPRRRVGAVPDAYALPQLQAAGAEIHLVEMRRTPLHPRNVAALPSLSALASRVGPDIIHGHSAIGGVLARSVITRRRVLRFYTPNGLNQSALSMRAEQLLRARTDQFIAVSESEKCLLQDVGRVDESRITVIPNAVGPDSSPANTADLRALAGFAPNAPLVGTVARLLPQKAPERFVACCRAIAEQRSDARFILIGDGPLAAGVDEAADVPSLRGRFVRIPDLQAAAPTLSQLDVFVLLSRFEGGPYAPLEAMLRGTPVVLSDAVGNADTLGDELREYAIPDGDPIAAANATLRLLNDDELRARVAEISERRVNRDFNLRVMGQRYQDLYRSALVHIS